MPVVQLEGAVHAATKQLAARSQELDALKVCVGFGL